MFSECRVKLQEVPGVWIGPLDFPCNIDIFDISQDISRICFFSFNIFNITEDQTLNPRPQPQNALPCEPFPY